MLVRKMDYTNLETYKIQMKYIKNVYDIKINEKALKFKQLELNKLMEVHKDIMDEDDKENIMNDMKSIQDKLEQDELNIKKFAILIEHIEILIHTESGGDLKYLDRKPHPENLKKWIKMSIKDFEEEYGETIKKYT